nr:fatty acid synthase-like [Leptinotarsa decemlineata]
METFDKIVISGIAGRFPECENVDQFKEALLNGVDLVTDNDKRYPAGMYGTPRRSGVIPQIDKLDNAYFGIHATQANYTDPRHRILLETTYECIVDAGYNPEELRGTKTGVYVGITSVTSLDEVWKQNPRGYAITGFYSSIAANRISYCFDFRGPSFSLDTGCSSGMYALANAVRDLKMGMIENAIVGVGQILYDPNDTKGFTDLNVLSPDGKCKVFQSDRNGFTRSETVASFLIQRESTSRRIYATVLGAKTNADGYKKEGMTFPSTEAQVILLKEMYQELSLDPRKVSYVEAHGTGTSVGDLQECRALSQIFCQGREKPLPIGSIKSNMGHSEYSAALSSLTKVIIAMESGVIPANLHVNSLDTTLPGISDNKLKVVTENLHWEGGIVGVNSFGLGGANAHAVLKSHEKQNLRNAILPKNRLVLVSGRTEEAVAHFLKGVEEGQNDEEFLALVDEIHKNNIERHPFRGFLVLGDHPVREIKKYTPETRPVWFIYPGMGSQWIGMGKDLMHIKVFRETLLKCAEALKPFDIDLEDVIMNGSPKLFENYVNVFVSITAIQVAMTSVLFSLGIFPDGIAGHSLGETACGYADGTLTPEETVLLSYARGKASTSVPLPKGLMAAVGLTKQQAEEILPEDTFIACHNGRSNLTISGLQAPMTTMLDKLRSQGIFAKRLDTREIAFHSKYIADTGPLMLEYCKKAIKTVKPRSARWITTSVPDDEMDEPWTKWNSPEYHYRNYLNPVLFARVYDHIPENALVVEIAPHGLFQSMLKTEFGPDVVNVSLASKWVDENEQFLLSAIGRMYLEGAQPNLRNFYPDVSFPVGRGTKMLSPLVKWDHSSSWFSELWKHADHFGHAISVDVSDEKYSYLKGHFIDGRIMMPATGYLELIWKVMAKLYMKETEELPVVIEDIKFNRATVLSDKENIQFIINIFKQSGNFEIFEGGSVVVSGKIRVPQDVSKEFLEMPPEVDSRFNGLYPKLSREDLYKECHLRRYMYRDSFKAITECDVDGLAAKIEWTGTFTSFMDGMLHPMILTDHRRGLNFPISIEQVVIDPVGHLKVVNAHRVIPLEQNRSCGVLRAGGIEITGTRMSRAPRRRRTQPDPYLETFHFVSYESPSNSRYDVETSMRITFQIIAENSIGLNKKLKILQVKGTRPELEFGVRMKSILDKQMLVRYEYFEKEFSQVDDDVKFDVIIVDEEVATDMQMDSMVQSLTPNGFVLHFGSVSKTVDEFFLPVFRAGSNRNNINLLKPRTELPKEYEIIRISNNDFRWLEDLKEVSRRSWHGTVYLLSQEEPSSGIVGLTKCLLAESDVSYKCLFIDMNTKKFSMDVDLFRTQLKKNLTINVLRDFEWGTFSYLPVLESKTTNAENASLSIETLGDLSTFKWIQRPVPLSLPQFPNQELVHVYYSSLNFRDVLVATASLGIDLDQNATAVETNLGFEYSGITSTGRRIMGISVECLALQVRAHPILTWEVPETWNLREAATVPVVYSTCFYAMIMKGQMKRGESILIQAGTGGIGLAAISIALGMEATVFTTVSTLEKREFLKNMFPELLDKYIGNSRDKSFRKLIMCETNGRGVDLVLNSLAGDLFQASLKCIAKRGRFLEIGKMDFTRGTPIDSSMFLKDCSFHGIQLEDHFGLKDEVTRKIHELLEEGIKNGVVKPLPSTVFNENEIESAFRFLSTGTHKGKVLINIRNENASSPSPARTVAATPKIYFDPSKTYIIVGGLGGIGLELANWLIERGATKIVLNSRRKTLNGYQGLCLKKWSSFKNVTVKVSDADTGCLKGASQLVLEAQKLGSVGGVFNTALVLRDGILSNQTKAKFEDVFKCKIVSGQNMDAATRKHCPDLEYFVMFSSISARGIAGQTNYGMANSALERLCEQRKTDKLPGLAIQWGPIRDVGILAGKEDQESLGLVFQDIISVLKALETLLLGDHVVGCSVVFPDCTTASTTSATRRTPAEATAHILGITKLDSIDKSSTLIQLGMDSLMMAEIKQTLYRNFHIELSVNEIRQLTFDSLTSMEENDKKIVAVKKFDVTTLKGQSYILSTEPLTTLKRVPNDDKIVFFVHPIIGRVDSMKALAEAIEATVYGLQCTKNTNFDTVPAFASYFIGIMREKQQKGPYHLCGYSYGAVLSQEIALQMEEAGEKVTIVAVDGSSEFMKGAAKILFESPVEYLKKTWAAILDIPQSEFDNIDAHTWEEALPDISTIVARKIGADLDLVNASLLQYYNRIRAGYSYRPRRKIQGKVTLIRVQCKNQYTAANDYGLQEFCQQEVDVMKVNGNHFTILTGDNVMAISRVINESL